MAEDKPRLVRLTAILTQLQSKQLVTAREIAKKHNVSIRTVYRDIRTLEQSGIPIVTEEGKGYSIGEGYKLPPVMFTEQEANALITAEQIILQNTDQSLADHYKSAIEKIKSTLKHKQKGSAELLSKRIQIRTNNEAVKSSNHLTTLQSAITAYQLVEIAYRSGEDKTSTRRIEPFALIHTQENWILVAFCRLRSDFRYFRLDRIEEFTLLNEHFDPHKLTLQSYFDEKRKIWITPPDTPLS
ncbi:MAG: helix-turn-helix transcriptional regulator [Saprospiraceae bacterium]